MGRRGFEISYLEAVLCELEQLSGKQDTLLSAVFNGASGCDKVR